MKAEAAKCIPRCRNCHQMQQTNNKYKRKYETIEEMPRRTKNEIIATYSRRYIDEKIAFVDGIKLEISKCNQCSLSVTKENCHVFCFAHIDARTKKKSVAVLCNSRATLKTTKPAILEEIAKCRLLCAVCHSLETRERNTLKSYDDFPSSSGKDEEVASSVCPSTLAHEEPVSQIEIHRGDGSSPLP